MPLLTRDMRVAGIPLCEYAGVWRGSRLISASRKCQIADDGIIPPLVSAATGPRGQCASTKKLPFHHRYSWLLKTPSTGRSGTFWNSPAMASSIASRHAAPRLPPGCPTGGYSPYAYRHVHGPGSGR